LAIKNNKNAKPADKTKNDNEIIAHNKLKANLEKAVTDTTKDLKTITDRIALNEKNAKAAAALAIK
jgi:hypothetical protein